jgi:hypothetical protein
MPRLGGGPGHSSPPRGTINSNNGNTAVSGILNMLLTRFFSPSSRNIRNILFGLILFFLLRNILRNDYRAEEKAYLRESGMTEEQIERYIPKTAAERKKYVENKKNDFDTMKNDIAYLLSEVAELKASAANVGSGGSKGSVEDGGGGDKSHIGRGAPLKAMDSLHEQKRKKHEEQLLKEHPNFKPSKRLRDSVGSKDGDAAKIA